MRIALLKVLEKEILGHIDKLAMVDQVLHRLPPLAIEGVKHAVVAPIELQRWHIEQFAEPGIERWRSLDPAPLQIQLGITVHGEHIAPEQLDQARRRQVIAYVRQADACGDAAMPGTACQ
ncbi:hypothetical protein D3C78_1250330 [compost metagenome]